MTRRLLLFLIPIVLFGQQPPPPMQTRQGRGGPGGAPNGTGVAAPQPAAPTIPLDQYGSVAGIMTNSLTGEPLGKATVSLRIVDSGDRLAGGAPRSYAATSDPSGQFRFPRVAPGKFRLSAKRTGFVEMDYGANDPQYNGSIVTLNAKQSLTGLLFRLIPHGVITGKILDQDGEPMQSAQVQAMKAKYSQGRKQLISYGEASTNDIGEFRVYGLPPGRYYLSVSPRRGDFGPPGRGPRTVTAQTTDEEYTSTYYPGTNDIATAIPVELGPGAQMRGFELTLRKKRTVHVRGRVVDTTGSDRSRMMVSLVPTGPAAPGSTRRAMRIDQNGNFEILSVPPGSYILIAAIPARQRSVSARVPLQIGSSNVENATITINPALNLDGRIRIEGNSPLTPANIGLSLRSLEPDAGMFGGPPPSVKSAANGVFQIQNVNPDLYALSLSGLPDGLYVKGVLVNGVDTLYTGLDLTRGTVGPIDIVLSPNAGQATGLVQNEQQQPAANVTVVIVPQEPERKSLPQYYRTASTDATGRFSLVNLSPGAYRVYAWEVVESGAYMDPDFMRPFENRGEPLLVKDSGKEDIQVKLTS
jgi:hypothetical protein